MVTTSCHPPCAPNNAEPLPGIVPPCGFFACDGESGLVNFELTYNFFEDTTAGEVLAEYITEIPFTIENGWPLSVASVTGAGVNGTINIVDEANAVIGTIEIVNSAATITGPGGDFAAGDSIRLIAVDAMTFTRIAVTLALQRPLSVVTP